MTTAIKFQLSALMFQLFFTVGAYVPVLSLYLKDTLHFSGVQVGMILSITATGSLVAPLVTAFIADRWIKAEHLLGMTQLFSGALMLVFAAERKFFPVIVVYFFYTLFSVPAFALANAIIFHHFTDSRHKFGTIRVWGTIGWIAVAWIFSYLWLRQGFAGGDIAGSRLPDALKLAACTSFVAGLYAFTLPANRPLNKQPGRRRFLPLDSLRILKTPAVLRLCIFMLFMSFIYRYYYFGTAPFLRAAGFSDNNIMPVMSLGQIPEVFAMGILSLVLLRFGTKRVILLGLLLDIFRYATAALGSPLWLVIAGLAVHGFAYTFIYTTASIYLDGFCDTASRTGVHQLFTLVTAGIGSFAGSIFCGYSMDWCTIKSGAVNYHQFWSIPAIGLSLLLIYLLFFVRNVEVKEKLK